MIKDSLLPTPFRRFQSCAYFYLARLYWI